MSERWRPDHVAPLPEREIAALLAADGRTRTRYFLSKAIDNAWVCAWGDQDGVTMWEDSEGAETIAFWPHPVYAERCYEGDEDRNDTDGPLFYRIDHVLTVSLPILRADGTKIGIFPVGNTFADVLSVDDFASMMESALGGVIDIS